LGEEGSIVDQQRPDEGERRLVVERPRVFRQRRVPGRRIRGLVVRDELNCDRALEELDRIDVEQRGLTMAPAATDWISLEEATAILAAANVRFRPATIGAWARAGKVQSIKLGGRRFVRRGEIKALIAAPRRVRASDLQPGLFEDLRD
jgi:hypothetical protein